MGAYRDTVQRAVVLRSRVMGALRHRAFDAFINTVHYFFYLLFAFNDSMADNGENMSGNIFRACLYDK